MKNNWFSITNRADAEPAEILIYDEIGKDLISDDGTGAQDFIDAASRFPKNRTLEVGINSPGGNVWDGLAIYHWLQRRGNTVTRNDGVAASIASVILMAGERVEMPETARLMVHMASSGKLGNADDQQKLVETLRGVDRTIATVYTAKNKLGIDKNLELMKAVTWLSGTEAKALGFIDVVTGKDAIKNHLDLPQFQNLAAQSSAPSKPQAKTQPDDSAALISASAAAVADGQQTAAITNPSKEKKSMSEPTTAPAVANPPADFTPVISAINALGDKLNTITANTLPGAAPLTGTGRVENLGNPLVERYNALAHDKPAQAQLAKGLYNDVRKQLMIANGCGDVILTPENRFDFADTKIRNANTVDAALANTILSGDFVTTMRTKTAMWSAFTKNVTLSPISRRQTLEVSLVSTAGGVQTNATNYESGDSTLAPIAVAVSEYSRSFHVTRPQTNLGLQLAALAPTNALVLAEALNTLFTAQMTNANFGADVVIGVATDFSSTDLPAILALGKNYDRCTLALDGGHLAYLLPTTRESFAFGEPGAYGFDGGIYKNNLWTSGATDIAGFVFGPDAIVSGWGVADGLPAGEAISQTTVDVNGYPFSSTVWFSRATREVWGSFQIMAGVIAGDKTQGEVLTTQ